MGAIGWVSADGTTVNPVSEANRLPVTIDGDITVGDVNAVPIVNGAYTDRSAVLTTGGTHQQLMAANASRKYLYISNDDQTDLGDIWINFGTTAVIGAKESIRLRPGDRLQESSGFLVNQSIDWVAANTGKKITAKEG